MGPFSSVGSVHFRLSARSADDDPFDCTKVPDPLLCLWIRATESQSSSQLTVLLPLLEFDIQRQTFRLYTFLDFF
jgi:hypothetical protein